MSIMQEYENVRKQMGEEKFQALEKYLAERPNLFLSDIYYKESEWKKFNEWYKELTK